MDYKKLREILNNVMADHGWYSPCDLEKKCEENGLPLNGNRDPIYMIMLKMKRNGQVVTNGRGLYKLSCTSMENDGSHTQSFRTIGKDEELISAVNIIEKYILQYKNFSLMDCSDEELRRARKNAKILNNLLKTISKDAENSGITDFAIRANQPIYNSDTPTQNIEETEIQGEKLSHNASPDD